MRPQIRLSGATLKVLRLLLSQPAQGFSGADISRSAHIGSGTLYPMLTRLELAGWLTSEWENGAPRELGRPRRRFYKLTNEGRSNALAAFNEFRLAEGELAWNS